VIGKTCKNVTNEHALDYVLGYTCTNDISARDWQREWGGGQYCRGKTFDTFAPLGPCITTADEIPNPQDLMIKTTVNGEIRQNSSTSGMLFGVAEIIAFLSGSTTLPAGSVIQTGTPHGVGMAQKPPVYLKAGDHMTIEIDKIGALTNPVIEEL
jgi:2-keto-4-pentenoate hydratase/2-oxohepta-3-ene-1,7-dioic acid hydratase in catechol pathway